MELILTHKERMLFQTEDPLKEDDTFLYPSAETPVEVEEEDDEEDEDDDDDDLDDDDEDDSDSEE